MISKFLAFIIVVVFAAAAADAVTLFINQNKSFD